MKNELDNRMKKYEKCYNFQIPSRTYTMIRFDGRGFSKYTKGFKKPFDKLLSGAMDAASMAIGKEFNGKLVYTQSDEISIMLTDIENIDSELPFGGKIQKLCSIGATCVANAFNKFMLSNLMMEYGGDLKKLSEFNFAEFDARVYQIPDFREVSNYFIWRQQDSTRNSVSMAACANNTISHKEQQNKNTNELQEMLFQKGINWNDYPEKFKRGSVFVREVYEKPITSGDVTSTVTRSRWAYKETPIFTQDKEFLYSLIPTIK